MLIAAHPPLIANHLLAKLSHREYQHLHANLERVTLALGEVLYESGDPIQHVYFPNDVLVSLLTLVEGHLALEVGLVGREGMVGTPLALGIDHSPMRALAQGSGTAMRMSTSHFRKGLQDCPSLRREVYCYIHILMAQVAQTAACNRFHVVEARLARRLLMADDYAPSNTFHLTHEFLASMLGVRRVGVTKAAHALQQQNLISYSRGEITLLDRLGLEAAACSCYKIEKHATCGKR
ncbi:MAG: Crp/Fnr family transcriptional regulator [Burkholderiales bacterium]|nr:Crp/Fnr family transcriptional regulator [Burkholderiales bacterium]